MSRVEKFPPAGGPPQAISIRGLVLVIHLFPAIMNAAAASVFYAIAASPPDVATLVVLAASVFLVSAAVGSLNDALDMAQDRAANRDKPIVRGQIGRSAAFSVAAGSAVAGSLLSLALGPLVLLIALVVLAAGVIYNVWLKKTLWSWVPYAIGIPALPVWGYVAAGAFTPVLLLSFPLGALIALALHVANTIPDIEGDRAFGVRGLAQRLGVRRSQYLVWTCFAVSVGFLLLTPTVVGNDAGRLLPGIVVGIVLLVAMIGDAWRNASDASRRRGWYASAVLGGILGVAWIVSLPEA